VKLDIQNILIARMQNAIILKKCEHNKANQYYVQKEIKSMLNHGVLAPVQFTMFHCSVSYLKMEELS
jgi:hypothetical protein